MRLYTDADRCIEIALAHAIGHMSQMADGSSHHRHKNRGDDDTAEEDSGDNPNHREKGPSDVFLNEVCPHSYVRGAHLSTKYRSTGLVHGLSPKLHRSCLGVESPFR